MTISITSPPGGREFLTTQTIPVEYSQGPPVSYQITPNGAVTSIPSGQNSSPISIPPISAVGMHTIKLFPAGPGKEASVVVKIVQGPDDPLVGGGENGAPA